MHPGGVKNLNWREPVRDSSSQFLASSSRCSVSDPRTITTLVTKSKVTSEAHQQLTTSNHPELSTPFARPLPSPCMTVSYASMLCLSTTHICISNWLLGRQAKLRFKESPPIHIPGWQLVYAVGGGVRSEPPKPLQVCAGGKPGQKRYTRQKKYQKG